MDDGDDGDKLEEKVLALITRALPSKLAGVTVTTASNLRRDLGLDSLGLATLFFHFGEELAVDSDDLIEMLADAPIHTAADMVSLAMRIKGGATEGPPV